MNFGSQRLAQPGWLLLSLLAPLYFGLISLHHAFSQPYIVQDDARLHLVWLQQWVDPALFLHDRIAQYYQAIQAVGFKAFYWLMAQIGVEPLLLAKLLPLPLALIATVYLFYLTLELLPLPACGLVTTLLLNQTLWIKDDLISATPRAFVYPLLIAFLYYLVRRSFWLCLLTIGLTGLFYPQILLLELAIVTVRLVDWSPRRFKFSTQRQDYWLCFLGMGVAVLVLVPFQQRVVAQFGPILTAAQMQQMPEFGLDGRREYFGVPPLQFIFAGASGLRLPLFPPILWASVALPFLLRTRLVTTQTVKDLRPLLQVGLASLGLWGLAHLLFPRLYLPSRYTFYSFRIIMVVAAGIGLSIVIEAGWRWWRRSGISRQALIHKQIVAGLMLSFAVAVVVLPAIPALFLAGQGWIRGTHPTIYRFFAEQPPTIQIASLTREADNIPAFSSRSVLVSRELALAYHPAFYNIMQQRIVDLLRAQYSSNLADVRTVIQKYGIDFWLIDQEFADPNYLKQQDWLIHSSFQQTVWDIMARLPQQAPSLKQHLTSCTVISEDNLIILDAHCINAIQSE